MQSRISPHWTRHSLGHILYAQHDPRRDERGISSLLLSMPSYATTDGTTLYHREAQGEPVEMQARTAIEKRMPTQIINEANKERNQ